ncbi:MAG TPA: hypothetical protein VNA28_02145 [Solirubrobacteraceae bacterium]|nr:hypothetical protein [Solirubrobacteraceae bacterium]
MLPAALARDGERADARAAPALAWRPLMFFFSNRLGCGGSILVSIVGTLLVLLVLGVIDL